MQIEADMARIVRDTRTIAVVGLSPRPERPSYGVARFLQSQGFRVIPVNPGQAGHCILGETVYPDLASIPKDAGVEMVDIFRRSEAVPAVVEEALRELPDLQTVWMQIGVVHDGAADAARAAGKTVVQNRCPKIEFPCVL